MVTSMATIKVTYLLLSLFTECLRLMLPSQQEIWFSVVISQEKVQRRCPSLFKGASLTCVSLPYILTSLQGCTFWLFRFHQWELPRIGTGRRKRYCERQLDSKLLDAQLWRQRCFGPHGQYRLIDLRSCIESETTLITALLGLDEEGGANDAFKHPRGIRGYTLSGTDFSSWKIAGNYGGEDIPDTVRGNLNEGGLWAEREGTFSY